jgi:magnesium transporter
MFSLSKGLVYYLDAINSNGMLLRRIGNGQRLALNETERELLEDISIDNQQSYRSAEIASDVLSTMMDARASVVNNNLNQLMKFLSVITFGVGMVTLVVSTFSMNVRIPLSQYDHAFWMVLGIAALALTLFFLFWRTRKW